MIQLSMLLEGFSTFLVSWCIHVLWWRIKRPKNDVFALFSIMIFIPVAILLLYSLSAPIPLWPLKLQHFATVALLHVALACAYIQTYPCAQAVSPSLEIMLIVNRTMPRGISESELARYFDTTKLVSNRFDDLINTKFIYNKNGVFVLSLSATILIRFFILYRKFLGLELKTG